MRNAFSISKNDLKYLWMEKQKERLFAKITEFIGAFTLQEMLAQMEADKGAFAEALAADTVKFGNKTENVEILTAFDLAEFYFPNENPLICFEVKDGFPGASVVSYDSIVANIESYTPVDCLIKLNGREFSFQIKRYPQAHLAHTREALSTYITETVRGYGNMKGTILIILLQPNTEEANDLSFHDLHEDIAAIKSEVSFDEIDLVYNDRGQQMRWEHIFPEFGYSVKPLTLLSEKYQAKQREWAKKTA